MSNLFTNNFAFSNLNTQNQQSNHFQDNQAQNNSNSLLPQSFPQNQNFSITQCN